MAGDEQELGGVGPEPDAAPAGTLSRQLDELRRELRGGTGSDAALRRVEVVAAIGVAYEEQLRAARRNLRQLEDLFLPVCMFCKRVRTDDSYWERIERFFTRRADITFSHGVCPACFEERFGPIGAPAAAGAAAPVAAARPSSPRAVPAARADGAEEDALRELRAFVESAAPPGSPRAAALQDAVDRVARGLARYRKVVEISDGYQEEFRRRLERAIRSDGLTGFATRAAALEAIEDAFERPREGRPAPALVVVQIAGLGALNRSHGHAVGDRAIVALSRALRTSAPTAQLRARWSGSAFALVVDAPGAPRLVDGVLRALRAVVVKHGDDTVSLEVEAGLAYAADAEDADAWVTAAEEAAASRSGAPAPSDPARPGPR